MTLNDFVRPNVYDLDHMCNIQRHFKLGHSLKSGFGRTGFTYLYTYSKFHRLAWPALMIQYTNLFFVKIILNLQPNIANVAVP